MSWKYLEGWQKNEKERSISKVHGLKPEWFIKKRERKHWIKIRQSGLNCWGKIWDSIKLGK